MSELRDTYHTLWNQLPGTVPTAGFATEKDAKFYIERDLDRKISLLQIAALIEIVERLGEKHVDTGTGSN
jgi:hypothetical protein